MHIATSARRPDPDALLIEIADYAARRAIDSKEAYDTAADPKRLVWLPGGHFDVYTGQGFEISSGAAREFFLEQLSHKVPEAALV